MNLDRIVVVVEGPADLQVTIVLVQRWVKQVGADIGSVQTYFMQAFRAKTFQKKVLAILNKEPTSPVIIIIDSPVSPKSSVTILI
ncbi:hypothetical protein IV102_11065 [bacterium]|nr:hypothetical protein [bacterium]